MQNSPASVQLTSRRRVLTLLVATSLLGLLLPAAGRADVLPPPPVKPVTLNIAAASDLKFALDELVSAYKKAHPGQEISVTYGSSGNFFAQISNGAPFDLFFSADVSYPQKLAEQGLVQPGSQQLYGVGRIVLWVPAGSKLELERDGLKVLQDPSVRRIALANPKHAPYGRAAEAAMKQQGVYDAVSARLVLGENVSQAAQFVQTGAAEVGIVALSLALSPAMSSTGRYWLIPDTVHPRLEQACVILKRTQALAAAEAFLGYIRGAEARALLSRYGFSVP